MIVKRKFLGIDFADASEDEILEYIIEKIKEGAGKFYIVTPNPEILVLAENDIRYKKVLNSANLALADGIGVIWGSKLLSSGINHKIAGVDLMENLCKRIAKQPITVSFLGGRPKIAERAAECLKKRYPSLKVTFKGSEMPNLDKLPSSDILFVAFGSPKQEIWIAENLEKLPVRIAIGVGGAFDFISGDVKRAPKLVRDLGFEWLFRLIIQPWRAKRQFSLLKFAFLVFREKLQI